MEKLSGLSHLFMTIFLHNFSTFMVIPAITDVTMSALCPGRDQCSLAIYLTGFQQAVCSSVSRFLFSLSHQTFFIISLMPSPFLCKFKARRMILFFVMHYLFSHQSFTGIIDILLLSSVLEIMVEVSNTYSS